MAEVQDPREGPKPSEDVPEQDFPGVEKGLIPKADHGEESYRGSGKLDGLVAIVTGGDSGIGRAVCIAFAREGADVLISYLNEDDDAKDTARHIEEAGRKAVTVRGDLSDAQHCRDIIDRAVQEFGKVDVLVSNAAYQMSHDSLDEISEEEWEYTFKVNVSAHVPPGEGGPAPHGPGLLDHR